MFLEILKLLKNPLYPLIKKILREICYHPAVSSRYIFFFKISLLPSISQQPQLDFQHQK